MPCVCFFCVIKPLCQEWAQDKSPQSLSGCLELVACPLEDPWMWVPSAPWPDSVLEVELGYLMCWGSAQSQPHSHRLQKLWEKIQISHFRHFLQGGKKINCKSLSHYFFVQYNFNLFSYVRPAARCPLCRMGTPRFLWAVKDIEIHFKGRVFLALSNSWTIKYDVAMSNCLSTQTGKKGSSGN